MSADNKRYASVEKHDGYVRDLKSNAIISSDRAGYETFVAKKHERRNMKDRLENVEKTLDRILEKLENIGK